MKLRSLCFLFAFFMASVSMDAVIKNGNETFPDGKTIISEWFRDTAKVDIKTLGKRYVLTDWGVKSDSTIVQTKQIQKIIDRMAKEGGGVLVVPQGTFLTGALFFKAGTHLHLQEGARLKGIDDIRHYPLVDMHMEGLPVRYFAALVNVDHADGFTITGHGTIDGNARRMWQEYWIRRKWNPQCTNLEAMRPQLVYIAHSDDVTVQDVNMQNSAFWTNHLYRCNRVKYLDCTIVAPTEGKTRAPSSDGIDLDDCDDVLVRGCYFAICDDGVAMKGGRGTFVDQDSTAGPVNRVIVENCRFAPHTNAGITLGSDAFSCHNIIMRNCRFEGANRVVYFKMRPDTPQTYEHVLIENCDGYVSRSAISIATWKQFHELQERKDMPVSSVRNVTFRNLRIKSNKFLHVSVGHNYKIDGVTMENIEAVDDKNGFEIKKIGGLTVKNVTLNGKRMDKPLTQTRQTAIQMAKPQEGIAFFDFERAAFGQVEFTLPEAVTGDTVWVSLGECVKDGRVDSVPGGSRRYCRIPVATVKGRTTYRPELPRDKRNTRKNAVLLPEDIGVVMPFRYVEIEHPLAGTMQAADVTRWMLHVPFNDEAAHFHCDDERLNRVWDFCKYSIKATSFCGIYVDGDRERIAYEADALINQLGHYACDTEYEMARRTFRRLVNRPTWPTEWSLQMVCIAWNDYLWTGNDTLLREYGKQLEARTLRALRDPETGLISTIFREQTPEFLSSIGRKSKLKDIVDWPHGKRKTDKLGKTVIVGGEDDGYIYTDFNTVVNAWHYEALRRLAIMQKNEGLKAESEAVKTAFNCHFLDTERGIYRDGIGTDHASLHANMFALCFGLVPEEYIASVTDFVVSRGMACSVYGSQFLLDALYESGHGEAALRLLTDDGKRSWLNMLREGSTITMEAWGNEFKSNQDWNHAWGAAPASIIPFRLMGIRPIEPGFARAEIRPQTAWLREAECRVPTIKGTISVNIRKSDTNYLLETDIPNGIQTDICLPVPDTRKYRVYMDGKRTKHYKEEKGYIRLEEKISGKHRIEIKQTGI